MMEVYKIPDDLGLPSVQPVQVYPHQSLQACTKQKVTLTQNTFSFLRQGQKEVYTGFSSISIAPTSFLMMCSGHCLMTEKLSASNQPYRSTLLFFSNEAVLNFIQHHNIPIHSDTPRNTVFAFQYDTFMDSYVRSLDGLMALKATERPRLLNVKFEELMLYLIATQGTQFLQAIVGNTPHSGHHFKQVVEHNKLNKLSLKELAFLCHMSVSTFKREFEKHFQSSPIKWFQDQRLDHAAFLLKQGNKRPSDLYLAAGYESLSNFIQAFKAKFGTTPKQHRLG